MLFSGFGNAQTSFDSFQLQGMMLDASGNNMQNATIQVRASVVGVSSTIYYQEEHIVNTGNSGVFSIDMGQGANTGTGSLNSLVAVDFRVEKMSLRIEVDPDASGYVVYADDSLWVVPYAFHSMTNDESLSGLELVDVDTIGGSPGFYLAYDGTSWGLVSQQDVTGSFMDSVSWAGSSDTTQFAATNGGWHLLVNTANAADWIGTNNSQDLNIYSNGFKRMSLFSDGKLGVGVSSAAAGLHVSHDDGFKTSGTYTVGAYSGTGLGERMAFMPKKAVVRIGGTIDTLWSESNSGAYSQIYGYHNSVRSAFSIAMGDSNQVYAIVGNPLSPGVGSVAIGGKCVNTGTYAWASGYQTNCGTTRSVAMGWDARTPSGYACVAIGKSVEAHGSLEPVVAIGNNLWARGKYSSIWGSHINDLAKIGCFMYADASTTDSLMGGSNSYQFRVRASGGVVFYSDSALTTGVQLFAGGGAWAVLSDVRKKKNITAVPEGRYKQIIDLPVYEWTYKGQKVPHVGSMAQDFSALGYGESDTTITTSDMDGVIFYGAKQLISRLTMFEKALLAQPQEENESSSISGRLDELEMKVERIKKQYNENK